MRQQIQLWVSRVLMLALLIYAVQRWGLPLYNQYFTPKKVVIFVPTAKVAEGKFTISFHEIGNLEAEKSVPVATETGGKIISLVDEGKVVAKGEKLCEMDTTELRREVRDKQLAYQNALADVDRAKAEQEIDKETHKTELDQSQAQLGLDQTELDAVKKKLAREERLSAAKLVPGSQVEQTQIEVRSKEFAVVKGNAELVLKKKDVQSKERQKEADVRNVQFRANMAKFSLEESQDEVKRALILAPTGGMVVLNKGWMGDGVRKVKEGDVLHNRQRICELPDLSKMLAKVQVGESDAPRVRVNMPVLIRLEAVPGKIFHGTVKDIASLATESDPFSGGSTTPGRKNFEVTISLKEADPKTIKPGMTGDVEFLCEEVKTALSIPIEAVSEKDGTTWVYVKNGKRYDRTVVKVGKHNDNFIIVTKGLSKNDIVALRDPTRPLDEQESGSAAPGADKDKKKAVPIPGSDKKGSN